MYFKGNLVLQVPFLPSKTLMFYQMTLKIKRIMQGAAPDVETAIWLALQETGEDCNAADAAFDEAAGLWRIHLTGEDGETTVWLGEDGVTRQVVDQPAKRIVYNGGENNEPSYKS